MKRNMDQLYHDLCRSYTLFHTGVLSVFNKDDVSYNRDDQQIVIRRKRMKHERNHLASYFPQIIIRPDAVMNGNYLVAIGKNQLWRSLAYLLFNCLFFVFLLIKNSGFGLYIVIALALSFVLLHATYVRSYVILLQRLREEVKK